MAVTTFLRSRFGPKFWTRNIARRLCSMQCLQFTELGDPVKVLSLKQLDVGELKEDEVKVKLLAAPINPADINFIQGTYAIKPQLPQIGGSEGVGEVLEIGSHVSSVQIGDWVLASTPGLGTWSTINRWPEKAIIKVRNDIPLLSAATLTVNPCTAYRMLQDFGPLKPGDVVVQNGANSAVGQAVIQFAHEMQLITINIIRNRPNLDEVKQMLIAQGASYVVTEEEFQNRDFMKPIYQKHGKARLALNCVGGPATMYLATALGDRGKLVSYGGMSKLPMQVPVGPLIFNYIELHGFWISRWNKEPENSTKRREMLSQIADLIKAGKFKSPDCEAVPLNEYKEAFKKSMEGFAKKQVFVFDSVKAKLG